MASAPIVTPPDAAAPPVLMERALNLVAIPAAHMVLGRAGLDVYAANAPFESIFGRDRDRAAMLAAMGKRVTAFLSSAATQVSFPWEQGDLIHSRHYEVTLARSTPLLADRCTISFVDRTAQERTERSLRREMATDSLTGLPNREGFGTVLEAVGGELRRHAVLVVDLTRFGRVNACLGSLAGDELLISAARRIKGSLRARDTLARIGGDEFGVLLAIDAPDQARMAAERVQQSMAAPFRLTDYQIRVDCAVGVALAADGAEDGNELVRHAQFAVKRAKQSGRVETYQAQAFDVARRQFSMETRLRRAIENGELRLQYQPICDLGDGGVMAFEALSRWTDEDGRAVSPVEFIPVAEESGLIVPLGRWAIEEATRTLAGWDERAGGDCGVQVAVNLSPLQLQRDSLVGVVERALAAAGLPGRRLKLELTESALIADPDGTARAMRALKQLGATLAMDDFGTGYSNLEYLQKLPIDDLKIDRSFVAGMLGDRDKVAIVRAILSLAQALGKRTVAEGIETVEQAATLSALGCHMGQGFLYARPLDAEAAYARIAPATA